MSVLAMKDLRRENEEEKNFCQQSVGGERTSASFHARLNLGIWPDATDKSRCSDEKLYLSKLAHN